jgi:DNA invertase Pin-like site-specific DNA recombinase
MKHIAMYVRVSKRNGQDVRSQLPDLERWANSQDQPVKWYRDQYTGRTMDRPGWNRLQQVLDAGEISAIAVWRLDRLGRTAKGLTTLFADLQARKINLVSLRDGLDLSTRAAGSWRTFWPALPNTKQRFGPSVSWLVKPPRVLPGRLGAVANPVVAFG